MHHHCSKMESGFFVTQAWEKLFCWDFAVPGLAARTRLLSYRSAWRLCPAQCLRWVTEPTKAMPVCWLLQNWWDNISVGYMPIEANCIHFMARIMFQIFVQVAESTGVESWPWCNRKNYFDVNFLQLNLMSTLILPLRVDSGFMLLCASGRVEALQMNLAEYPL